MKKTILLAGIVTASAVIVVSFFMPWAKVEGSVMSTAGRLADSARELTKDMPMLSKFFGKAEKATGRIREEIGDVHVQASLRGVSIPVLVNSKFSKAAVAVVQVIFKTAESVGKKSYLVYLIPLFGIASVGLAFLGLTKKICIVIMTAVSGAISIAGLYNLATADLTELPIRIAIAPALWAIMYGFLAIFVAGIAWLLPDR